MQIERLQVFGQEGQHIDIFWGQTVTSGRHNVACSAEDPL